LDYHSGKLLPHHTKRRDCISREDITAAQTTLANLAANAKTTRIVAQKIAGLKPEQPIPELPVAPDAPVITSHLSSKELISLKRTLRRLQSLRHPGSMTEVLGRQYDDSELAMFVKHQSTYKKYTELCQEVRGLKHFPPELELSEAEATAQLAQLRALHAKVDYVAESLDELEAVPEPDVTLEQLESELAALEADREQQRELRRAGLQLLELNEAADTRNEAIAKTEALLVRQVGLDKIKHLISETVSHALETTVDTINSVLADISNELYDDGTVIAFSMFKQLKTKDYIKAQPNVQITRGTDPDSILSYDVEELSGGEKSRLSLALALALAATCSTPFLFIDEGMSSMDPSLRERCMKIISAYTPNKIVINVCHGIVEGFHGHVVDLNP
jgi:DNA repair exonuclease SbcCD ATPase subunit